MKYLFQKNNWLSVAIIIVVSNLASVAVAQTMPVTIDDTGQSARLQVTLPAGVKARAFSLKSPPRLVVDVPNSGVKPNVSLPGNYGGTLVRKVRSGQFNADTGRIVFELSRDFNMTTQQHGRQLNILIRPFGDVIAKAGISKAPPPKPKPKPKKKIIVLDAGHGGQDPGAHGHGGTQEKTLVLKFAKELKAELDKTGKYQVVLTREGDYYIALRKRLAFARKNNADIFISLHADSASAAARGLSIYTLSENASDKEAEALAIKENKSDIIAGVDLGDHDKDVADILISLAQRETNNQSTILADTLVASLKNQHINLLPRPHRYAGFAVLKAPDVPSILVEIGFLSNREEEKALNRSSHRQKLAKGLTKAIGHYFDETSRAFE